MNFYIFLILPRKRVDSFSKLWHSIRAQEKAHTEQPNTEYLLQFCREQREEKQRQANRESASRVLHSLI